MQKNHHYNRDVKIFKASKIVCYYKSFAELKDWHIQVAAKFDYFRLVKQRIYNINRKLLFHQSATKSRF